MFRTVRLPALVLILVVSIFVQVQCSGNHTDNQRPLSEHNAVMLAVRLANSACLEQFAAEPFDSTSYQIVFAGNRWQWGEATPSGIDGYSAIVSFDSFGDSVEVEVTLSTDMLD